MQHMRRPTACHAAECGPKVSCRGPRCLSLRCDHYRTMGGARETPRRSELLALPSAVLEAIAAQLDLKTRSERRCSATSCQFPRAGHCCAAAAAR